MSRFRSLFPFPVTALCCVLASIRAAEPIKVGEFESLTGREAGFGQQSRKGYALALETINARGGVLGRPLELVVEDVQSKTGDSATVARKLAARDKVVALLSGGTSTNAIEAAPFCEAARIPLIASAATNPRVTAMGTYCFRVCFIDPFQGTVLAKFAREQFQAKRAALLVAVNSAYSVGLAGAFREAFTAAGGTIDVESKYNEGEKDFRAQLTAIRAAAPDVLILPGYFTEAALICQQAQALGLKMPVVGGDGWQSPQLMVLGGPAVEGTYYSTHFSPEDTSPAVQDFVTRYRAKYGDLPAAGDALAYDSLLLLADAIGRVGTTDGPKLRDALAATKDFAAVTGRLSIDAQRNATKAAVILVVRDGQAHFFQSISP
jgi:branched-chain amino acid transport system substrate-binding protein